MNEGFIKMQRHMTKKKEYRIGLFLGSFFDKYEITVFNGVLAGCKEEKVQLISFVGGSLDDPHGFSSQRNTVYNLVNPHKIDGIISVSGALGNYIGTERLTQFYNKFSPIPIVSIGVRIEGCTSILVDNAIGMRECLHHLIKDHGHRRLAFIKGPEYNPEAKERFMIYKQVLDSCNIAFDPDIVAPGDFSAESGKEAIHYLLKGKKAVFDVLIAANDYMAIAAIKELRNYGINVPHDMSVVGFDDIEESRFNNPPLTTVQQPLFKMGYKAVNQLVSLINGEKILSKVDLPSRLVIRRSCHCAGIGRKYMLIDKKIAGFILEFKKESKEEREFISYLVQEMEQSFSGFKNAIKTFEWAKSLFFALFNEVKQKSDKIFLYTLEEIILEASEIGIDTLSWYTVMISFFQKIFNFSVVWENRSYTNYLWKATLVLIGEIGGSTHAYRRLRNNEENADLLLVNQALATTFSVTGLQHVLARYLPTLGINHCYIALYDSLANERRFCRLIFAYKDNIIMEITPETSHYLSIKLIPESIELPICRNGFLVLPLFFKNSQLGFMVIENGPLNNTIYQSLAIQISGALEGSFLLDKVEKQAGKLQEEVINRTSDLQDIHLKLKHEREELEKVQNELTMEKERALVTLESIGDGVITTDNNGIITYLNPVAEKLTGWKNSEAIGLTLGKVLKVTYNFNDGLLNDPTEIALGQDASLKLSGSIILKSRNGRVFSIKESISPIRNFEKQTIGVVIVIHNVSEIQLMSQKIMYQSTHDALTSLLNRARFEELLSELILNIRNETIDNVFCFIDIDKFKIINETFGTVAGDELLRHISAILKKGIRSTDTLARLGADQFGVLFSCCPMNRAREIAEELCKLVYASKFRWKDNDFKVCISIGLIPLKPKTKNIAKVFSSANMACSIAKKKGGNKVHVYTTEDKELIQYQSDINFISHISKALDEDRFCLYSQVIQPIGTTITFGEHYEILIRMIDENDQILAPEMFISAAERYNIMPTIDRWAICKLFSSYKIDYNETVYQTRGKFSINLSGATLNDEDFLDFVFEQFEKYDIPPFMICFEITETAAISNFSRVVKFIKELKKIGCCFSLDDFGTGWASFNYLKHLPVDFLKIDGSFVKGMDKNPLDYVLVETINHIGHVMGLETIAEYVETENILVKLKTIGVNYAQGYIISRPKPLYF
ncbi:MAG: EAL domain-containing protein [Spirochaetales bacterium]|nr:EAL domain-containing protein [Spirochaetales bacterium]